MGPRIVFTLGRVHISGVFIVRGYTVPLWVIMLSSVWIQLAKCLVDAIDTIA